METVTRFFQAGAGSFFLFGPRGTGKSTWLAQNIPDALTIDLLAPDLFRSYAARPERRGKPAGTVLNRDPGLAALHGLNRG